MTTVIEIVRDHLKSIGADGLCLPDAECGCKLDDLVPCADCFDRCQPGYISTDADGDWTMWPTKELAKENGK